MWGIHYKIIQCIHLHVAYTSSFKNKLIQRISCQMQKKNPNLKEKDIKQNNYLAKLSYSSFCRLIGKELYFQNQSTWLRNVLVGCFFYFENNVLEILFLHQIESFSAFLTEWNVEIHNQIS